MTRSREGKRVPGAAWVECWCRGQAGGFNFGQSRNRGGLRAPAPPEPPLRGGASCAGREL